MENNRNFSLSLWDHKDNFLCLLKSANSNFEGQSFNEYYTKNINGEKTLTFSIPMYVFDKTLNTFKVNDKWRHIFNEQKIRLTFYDKEENNPIEIEEFILKDYVETRNNEEKIAECTCISLAVYELGKIGWEITFNESTPSLYEMNYTDEQPNCPDLLSLDYWLRKIFYTNTSLGRVSTIDEATNYLRGVQLRDSDGYAISDAYEVDASGNFIYKRIDEPIATSTDLQKHYNPTGWHWDIRASFENDPAKQNIHTIYEKATISKYIRVAPDKYEPFSYQKRIGTDDSTKELRLHPIPDSELKTYTYVTDEKRRLVKCERSNIFSIISDLCETFEVWAYFQYTYNQIGRIVDRCILFKTESVNDEVLYDFAYGKNLQGCSRECNSDDLITKLYVPDMDSQLIEGNVISIKKSTSNPTSEGYIYNFDYFFDLKSLNEEDREEINKHMGLVRNYNDAIVDLQEKLLPLYDRQTSLSTSLDVAEASLTALQDNIQSLQDKIDAIPESDQVIQSWSNYYTENNHVGELRTITDSDDSAYKYYINFGREDVLYSGTNLQYKKCYVDDNGEFHEESASTQIPGYSPHIYRLATWSKSGSLPDTDSSFIDINNSEFKLDYVTTEGIPDYTFIKGVYLSENIKSQLSGRNYVRARYKYCPLVFYYTQMKYYWDKIGVVKEEISDLKSKVLEINNKIFNLTLNLNNKLRDKNELIHNFEIKYKTFIKEGYWQPSDYQSERESVLKVNAKSDPMIYHEETNNLFSLNLNDSLHNYSYYFVLDELSNIKIESIEMWTQEPNKIPRYRYNDFELYNGKVGSASTSSPDMLIVAISPALIDSYDLYDSIPPLKKNRRSYVNYETTSGVVHTSEIFNWETTDEPVVKNRCFYLTDDNLLTSSLIVNGIESGQEVTLTPYEDYSYGFKSIGYDSHGNIVDLDEQTSYSTDIKYDYVTRVELNLTDKSNRTYTNYNIKYDTETTLQYFYNDAVATEDKYSVPQVSYEISVLNLSRLDGYENYEPKVGQKVPIWDLEMGLKGYQGLITSVEYDLELPQNTNITIATYATKFEDIFNKLVAASSTVSYNETNLLRAADSISNNNTIKTDVFQSSLDNNNYQIQLGVNNEIVIDKQSGITLTDKDNGSAVKIIGNGIFLTPDSTQENVQWKTGITGNGINANALTAGSIDTKNINIWNASEGQIRFIWNEQGLFAYGDANSTSTGTTSTFNKYQEMIDYNKYVKFNYDGLKFVDYADGIERSGVSLGWDGLKINAQSGSLTLDANDGLKVTDGLHERLHLGKIDANNYGLVLNNTNGNTTFRNDSTGNLWLSGHINVGGTYNAIAGTYSNITAGVRGETSTTDVQNVIGIVRDINTGNVTWNNNPIRFWAGPLSKEAYLSERQIKDTEITGEDRTNWNNVANYSPTTAKFKVGADGTLVASGIDVGGWIGGGTYLRSNGHEVILRSKDYTVGGTEYPAISVGKKPSGSSDGTDYNFRVYQDGTVIASKIQINGSESSITAGKIANWTIGNNGLYIISGNYTTGMYPIANSTSAAFKAGLTDNPAFVVNGNGAVLASNLTITGGSININGDNFSVDSLGNVRFKGDIYAYSSIKGGWRKGLNSRTISVIGSQAVNIEVVNGLIIDVS